MGGDHPPWDRLATLQRSEPWRGHDDDAKPSAADIPAVAADVDSGELIAAQLPQVLVMHDASDGSEVWSCARESSRGNQRLGRVEDGHNYRMGTCGTRLELPSEKRKVDGSTLPLTTKPLPRSPAEIHVIGLPCPVL